MADDLFHALITHESLVINFQTRRRGLADAEFNLGELYDLAGPLGMACGFDEESVAARVSEETGEGPYLSGIGGVGTPELIQSTWVPPQYPESGRQGRIEGVVVLQAIIQKDGNVGEIKVLKGVPGFKGFAKEAVRAIRQWRYEPARRFGKAVNCYLMVSIQFTLG